MALNAYLRLVGSKQGEIKGSVTQKGRDGKILVIAVSHGIERPYDDTGLPTGKTQLGPLVITKEADRATVPLRDMLVSNETAKEFELQFWRADAAGRETQYYTITLGNALLVSIDLEMPNNKHPDLATLETFEVVTFTYQRVEWTWADGGLVAVADREIA